MSSVSKGKKLCGAFLVAGIIGAVMQLVYLVLKMVLPGELKTIASAFLLVILGFIGMILVLNGTYAKLNEVGGFGAAIVFSGLVDALSGIYAGTYAKTGKTGSAVGATLKFALMILGTIIVVSTAVGAICAGAFPAVMGNFAPVEDPGALGFLWAFLCCGVIGGIGQILLDNTNMPLPAVILLEAACGVVIAVFGAFGGLEATCGAGMICTVVDGAGGLVMGGALLVAAGNPTLCVVIITVMVIVVIIGLITGAILSSRAAKSVTSDGK